MLMVGEMTWNMVKCPHGEKENQKVWEIER